MKHSIEVVQRRINLLISLGENVRNTASWREAVAERDQLNRSLAFASWKPCAG